MVTPEDSDSSSIKKRTKQDLQQNENIARPIGAELVFRFFDELGRGFPEKVLRLILLCQPMEKEQQSQGTLSVRTSFNYVNITLA